MLTAVPSSKCNELNTKYAASHAVFTRLVQHISLACLVPSQHWPWQAPH